MKQFLKDFWVALKNIFYLKDVTNGSPFKGQYFHVYPETTLSHDDEDSPIPSSFTLLRLIYAYYMLDKDRDKGRIIDIFKVNDEHNAFDPDPEKKVYFVNGIMTGSKVAEGNAMALSFMLKKPVTVLHNPTYGFIIDLAECVFGRTLDKVTDVAEQITKILRDDLKLGREVHVCCHSQGGIIMSNVIKLLGDISQYHDDARLIVTTFGSGADEFEVSGENVIIEHFANEGDYVARIGVLEYADRTQGAKYVSHNKGHLLNMHYLENIVGKVYINQDKSEFCKRLDPEHMAYLESGKSLHMKAEVKNSY